MATHHEEALVSSYFRHEPLDLASTSIRLIELLSCTPPDPIRCNIRHSTTAKAYACLSYVWDDSGELHVILLNQRPFQVRKNSFTFLEYLSTGMIEYNDETAGETNASGQNSVHWPLRWIDTISIDQDNVMEQNHQVQQMGRIYSHALQVMGWFGDEKDVVSLF